MIHDNSHLIQKFYTAFQRLDYATMQSCYDDKAIFNDPAFGLLEGDEVFAMWELLCKSAENFSLAFSNIQILDEEYATCDWIATYIFSKTGNQVVNKTKTYLRIQNGKITEQTDHFDLWKWSRQALGLSGWLLGWSRFFHAEIRATSILNLEVFMGKPQA